MLRIVLLTSLLFAYCVSQSAMAQNQATAKSQWHERKVPIEIENRPYPIDPRKPSSGCVRPCDCKATPKFDLPGLRGRPHVEKPVGGCSCGKKHGDHHPGKSWNWSLPFSAHRQEHHPQFANWLDNPCRKRLTNVFDELGDFRLINYKRTDSGYSGMGRDPYGCLGESRIQSRVSGLQFRQPGEPAFGSPNLPRN